jgi:rod shape determining protein RodA
VTMAHPRRPGTAAGTRSRARSAQRLTAVRLDWVLVAASLALSVFGCVLVSSAGAASGNGSLGRKQLLGLLAALVLGYLVTRVEPRSLRAWAPTLYLASVAGVLLAYTPLGVEIAGARAWVALPLGFTLQPSEFAKLALIVALAATLAVGRDDATVPDRTVVQALGIAAVPLALVLLGNDTGSAMIVCGIVAAVMLVAEVSWRWLAGLAAAAVAVAVLAISTGLLADYQMKRIMAFLDPTADPTGFGLNTVQSRIAVGSGGAFGQGLFAGPQTQGGFVPVNDSDFVFTVAAEELGFVGGMIVLVCLSVILWRGLRIAFEARDMFTRLVAVGVVAWFALQSFENIGMTLGITPVTGVTLPFVSYGGSSMVAAWLGVGLLQLVRLAGGRATRS